LRYPRVRPCWATTRWHAVREGVIQMRRKVRYMSIGLVVILVGLVMIPGLLMAWWFARAVDWIGTPFGEQPFSAVAWQAVKNSNNRDGRAKMARDLIDHYLRVGMPETRITSLLGTQDKTWPAGEYSPPLRHDVYEYDMGSAPMDMAGQHYVLRLY